MSSASCCPSPSIRARASYPRSRAYRNAVWTAPPIPRLHGRSRTVAPALRASPEVSSGEPSLTTRTSYGYLCRMEATTGPIDFASR